MEHTTPNLKDMAHDVDKHELITAENKATKANLEKMYQLVEEETNVIKQLARTNELISKCSQQVDNFARNLEKRIREN